jgi:hypothetical protein
MNLFSKIHKVRVKNLKTRQSLISILLNLSLLLLVLYPLLSPQKANATVTEGYVRFDRLSSGAPISGTACLKSTLSTQTSVVLVLPITWTISQTAGNWTVSTSNLPYDPQSISTQATAWPGINTATAVGGTNITFPGTALTPGTFYCFNFVGASSTIGAAGNDQAGQLKTMGGSPYSDSINWAISTVTPGMEQILVTASVSATMTFSINATSSALGTLTTSAGAPNAGTAITQSVSTNARNGWVSWIKGANPGSSLHSTTANADITSSGSFDGAPTDLSGTGAGYGVDVNLNTCSGCSIPAEYNGTGDVNYVGHIDVTFHETAYHFAALTAAETVDLRVRAKAGAFTPAGSDYTDTLTVTAAGSF